MSFVYDVKMDYFVMFGGFSDQGFFGDTWILDPNISAWIEVNPEVTPPPLRSRMVYDDSRGVSVLFGGDTIPLEGHQGSAVPYGKTWSYDSTDQSWTEILTKNGPTPRALNGIAYDTDSDTIVIFGGTDTLIDDANFVGHEFQDTWVLALEKGGDDFSMEFVIPIIVVAAALGIFVIARKKQRKTSAE